MARDDDKQEFSLWGFAELKDFIAKRKNAGNAGRVNVAIFTDAVEGGNYAMIDVCLSDGTNTADLGGVFPADWLEIIRAEFTEVRSESDGRSHSAAYHREFG